MSKNVKKCQKMSKIAKIAKIENILKENQDILTIISLLNAYVKKELGFMCES